MRPLIAALALSLTVFGQTAFAVDECRTSCTTTEFCDGYCEQVGLEYCDPWWAILEVCQPFNQSALQELGTSSTAPAAQESRSNPGMQDGFRPRFKQTGRTDCYRQLLSSQELRTSASVTSELPIPIDR